MNIAICISGHVRNFHRNVNGFVENFIDVLKKEHDVDVFFSSWTQLNSCYSNVNMQYSSWDIYNYISEIEPILIVLEDYELIKDRFKIENILANQPETLKKIKEDKKQFDKFYNWEMAGAAMFYKIQNANYLRKSYEGASGKKYDCVFRARPDLIFARPFYFDFEVFRSNILYNHRALETKGSISDWFWWGSPQVMDVTCDAYLHLPTMLSQGLFYMDNEQRLCSIAAASDLYHWVVPKITEGNPQNNEIYLQK